MKMPDRAPHEILLLELSEQSYNLWRHNPITAAYLAYLGDQIEAFRSAAIDLLENGALSPQADVIRGRLLTLRELQSLELKHIQNFYRKEETGNDGEVDSAGAGTAR